MKVLDVKNKKLVTDYSNIERKVASGEYAFEKGAEIDVISPDGEKGTIPSENAQRAFAGGYTFYSPLMKQKDAVKKEYGEGIGAEATAAALGAARGVTFGLSDQALTKLELIKPEALKLYRDLNPSASLTGEIGGAVVPALLSGGTSAVGSIAAKTAPALAQRAGLAIGGAAAKKLTGKIASKSVSKIVEKATKAGVGSAVEGALYGSGQLLTEDAIGDAEFNAENLIKYTAEGGLIGGLTGTGLSLAGSGAKKVSDATRSILGKSFKGKNLDTLVKKTELDDVVSNTQFEPISEDKLRKAIESKFKSAGRPDLAREPIGASTDNWLFRMTESSLRKQPTAFGEKVRAKYNVLYDELERETMGILNGVDLEKPAQEFAQTLKGKVTSMLDDMNNKASKLYDDLGDQLDSIPVIQDDIDEMVSNLSGRRYVGIFNSDKYIKQLTENFDIQNLDELKKVRSAYGRRLKKAYGSDDYEVIQDIYSELTRMRNQITKDAANAIGGELPQKLSKADEYYKLINNEAQEVSNALGINAKGFKDLQKKIAGVDDAKLRNKIVNQYDKSKLDKIRAFAPEAYEEARSSKMAELYKKSLDGQSSFNAKKFISNVKKSDKHRYLLFGDQSLDKIDELAAIFDKIPAPINPSDTNTAEQFLNLFNITLHGQSGLQYMLYKQGEKGINKYIKETVDVLKGMEKANNRALIGISDSIDSFIKGSKQAPTISVLNAGESRDYEKAIEIITEFENNPDKTLEDLTTKNKILFDNAPRTSEAYSGKMMQIYQFLKEKAPNSYEGVGFINNYGPSKSEKHKFMKYFNYANNPDLVLKQMNEGIVSPEGVETLRSLYPKTYELIYDELTSRMSEVKKLTYNQKKGLYKMLSIMGASSLMPQNLQMLQGQMQDTQAQVQNNKRNVNHLRVTGLREVSQANRFKTKLDKLS